MRLIPLGVAGAYTAAGEASPGYLIEEEGKYLLLDAGPGITGRLAKIVPYYKLSAIIVSHLHFDHMLDLLPLSYVLHIKHKTVPLYFPRDTKSMFFGTYEANEINPFLDAFDIHDTKGEVEIGPFKIKMIPVNHRIATVGTRVETDSGTIAYTGDTAMCDCLIDLAKNADIFLSEATYQERDRERTKEGHMTAKQAAEVAMKANVKKLLLTHIWFEYDKRESLKEAKEIFENTELAIEMHEYRI